MAKKSLHFFSFILWLLIFCTLFSGWVEEQMMPQVKVYKSSQMKDYNSMVEFSKNILFEDSDGYHLYYLEEGDGWETGYIVKEREPFSYEVVGDLVYVQATATDSLILYSTKPLTEEMQVKKTSTYQSEEALYLVTTSEGNASIISMKAPTPFMESEAKTLWELPEESHVYPLSDFKQFSDSLPKLSVVLMLFLIGLFCWACKLQWRRLSKVWNDVMNYGLQGVLLALVEVMLTYTSMPSSLMPASNVFDFKYYSEKIAYILTALRKLADEGMHLVRGFYVDVIVSALILGVGIFAIVLIISRRRRVEE